MREAQDESLKISGKFVLASRDVAKKHATGVSAHPLKTPSSRGIVRGGRSAESEILSIRKGGLLTKSALNSLGFFWKPVISVFRVALALLHG